MGKKITTGILFVKKSQWVTKIPQTILLLSLLVPIITLGQTTNRAPLPEPVKAPWPIALPKNQNPSLSRERPLPMKAAYGVLGTLSIGNALFTAILAGINSTSLGDLDLGSTCGPRGNQSCGVVHHDMKSGVLVGSIFTAASTLGVLTLVAVEQLWYKKNRISSPTLKTDHASPESVLLSRTGSYDDTPVQDQDGDGIIDPQDKCPKTAGPAKTLGCPDTDEDGISNEQDVCPLDPGSPPTGCPSYSLLTVHGNELRTPERLSLFVKSQPGKPPESLLSDQAKHLLRELSSFSRQHKGALSVDLLLQLSRPVRKKETAKKSIERVAMKQGQAFCDALSLEPNSHVVCRSKVLWISSPGSNDQIFLQLLPVRITNP